MWCHSMIPRVESRIPQHSEKRYHPKVPLLTYWSAYTSIYKEATKTAKEIHLLKPSRAQATKSKCGMMPTKNDIRLQIQMSLALRHWSQRLIINVCMCVKTVPKLFHSMKKDSQVLHFPFNELITETNGIFLNYKVKSPEVRG